MQDEISMTYKAFLALICLSIGCFLYSIGGRSLGGGKWIRRFLGSFLIALTVNLLSVSQGIWTPLLLAVFPLLSIGFHLGYGADIVLVKILKRLSCVFGVCSAGLICAIAIGGNAWLILPLHLGVGAWSIWLGVKNPLEAAAEETFICLLLNAGLMMYPFVS